MSTPAVLRWAIPWPFSGETGERIACPQCGAVQPLVVAMDLDAVDSQEPTWLTCPAQHTWAEADLPQCMPAQLLADVLDAEPGLFANLDELRREYGDG
ncbi:hypothetical protein HKX69_29995 [Streptomyces argyrophyllae]|uniref:Uncharacterized protein n=1 Tax=Streptomyces argyrophylli TaxID=2726118 RepID=A0A6M4PQH1_9ACTN|nr:hypothetical protein [Streptomyces argyrophyllae]QJS13211.1 hypothetical protein HKX69_29995 [Streptomyces argyrophyllae]